MASDIRRWAGAVLANAPDDDTREQERRSLEQAAGALDSWRAGFLERRGELSRPSVCGRLHSSTKLLQCALWARSLESGAEALAPAFERAMRTMLPDGVGHGLVEEARA